MNATTRPLPRDDEGQLTAYAWPGGYPVFYLCDDGGVVCPDCARQAEREELTTDPVANPGWSLIAAGVNWECSALYCDHCGRRIESAYAEPDEEPGTP